VTAIQEALKDKGHDPGTIDGVMGPKTRAALQSFQKAEGIATTGRPDASTLTALGVESDTSTGAGAKK
jgi:peptidoglycan hydrolase-like protein with peptidoglycan-binding domain